MSDSTPPSPDALTVATQLVKEGRLDRARETLMQYLVKNPSSEQAWLLMSYVLSDPAKQKDCLERVLKINPNNTVAQSKLAHLLGRRTEELFKKKAEPPAPPAPSPSPVSAPKLEAERESKPVVAPAPKPIPAAPKPASALLPHEQSEPFAIPAEPPPTAKKSLFSGTWFRIVIIFLLVLIGTIVAVILYLSVVGPMINSLSSTATLTPSPVVNLTLPPEWTRTLTPTVTPNPPPTLTLTGTATPTLPETSTP